MTWFSSQFTNGEDWAKSQVVEVGIDEKTAQFMSSGWTDLSRTNTLLQFAMVSFCRDAALTVIRNSLKGQGWTLGADFVKTTSFPVKSSIVETSAAAQAAKR